jgi:hypothetical protein
MQNFKLLNDKSLEDSSPDKSFCQLNKEYKIYKSLLAENESELDN